MMDELPDTTHGLKLYIEYAQKAIKENAAVRERLHVLMAEARVRLAEKGRKSMLDQIRDKAA